MHISTLELRNSFLSSKNPSIRMRLVEISLLTFAFISNISNVLAAPLAENERRAEDGSSRSAKDDVLRAELSLKERR